VLVFLEDYKSMKPDSCIYETIYRIDVFRDPRVETWHEESSDVFEYIRLNHAAMSGGQNVYSYIT